MFCAPDRIDLMRDMILSENVDERTKFLNEMLPFQRQDFLTIFRECNGRQVIDISVKYVYLYIHITKLKDVYDACMFIFR